MTEQNTGLNIVNRYLTELRFELRFASVRDRDEYLSEIAEHIAEGRAGLDSSDSEGLSDLLTRLGSPEDLASDFYESEQQMESRLSRGLIGWPRQRIVLLSMLLALTLLITAFVWVSHYQPVPTSPTVTTSAEVVTSSGSLAQRVPNGGSNPTLPTVWEEPLGRFTVAIIVNVNNSGSLPISVSDVQSPLGNGVDRGSVSIRFDSSDNYLGGAAFHPFSLRGHQTRSMLILHTLACTPKSDSGSYWRITNVPVTTSFFGFHHTVLVPVMPFEIQIAKTCK